MNKILQCILIFFMANGMLFSYAYAFMPTLYLGVDAGYGYIDFNDGMSNSTNDNYQKTMPVWGGNGGILVTRNFGLDFTYLKFGNITISSTLLPNSGGDVVDNNILYVLALKGILYGDEGWNISAKAGVSEARIHYVANANTLTAIVPYVAFSVSRNLTKHVSMSLVAHATTASGQLNFTPTGTPNRVPAFYAGTLEVTYTL